MPQPGTDVSQDFSFAYLAVADAERVPEMHVRKTNRLKPWHEHHGGVEPGRKKKCFGYAAIPAVGKARPAQRRLGRR